MIVPSLENYLPNAALHAILTSAAALAAAACFRTPTIRAASAALGVLAVAVIPWVSAVPASSGAFVEPLIVSAVAAEPAAVMMSPAAPAIADAGIPRAEAPREAVRPHWRDAVPAAGAVWAAGIILAALAGIRGGLQDRRWKGTLRMPKTGELELIRRALPDGFAHARVRIGGTACVVGFVRPVLVLPESLMVPGCERELAWAARHESGHLKAHDLRWLALLRVAQALFWWNPIVHRLVGIWSEAREQTCDRLAVRNAGEAPRYAEFLLGFARDREHAAGIAMADRRPVARLKRRLRSVVEFGDDPPVPRTLCLFAAVALILAGAGCSQIGVRSEAPPAESVPAMPAAQEATIRQVTFKARLLAGDSPFARDGQVFDDDEMTGLMRKAAQTKGTLLIAFPTITARSGQPATFELLRTHPDDPVTTTPKADIQIDDSKHRYVGLVIYSRALIRGDSVNLQREFVFALPPGRGWEGVAEGAERNPPPVDWERVRKIRASSKARLESGQWIATRLGRDDLGRYGTVFTEVEVVEVPRQVPPAATRQRLSGEPRAGEGGTN